MEKLTRQDFLATNDIQINEHVMKAKGYQNKVVYIKSMSTKEQAEFENISQGKDKKNILAKIVVMCVCDEAGNKLFTDHDIDALNNKSAAALIELSNAVIETNFMTDEDIEDLAKN